MSFVAYLEGGARLAALKGMLEGGYRFGHETVVLFLTGTRHKHQEVMQTLAERQES